MNKPVPDQSAVPTVEESTPIPGGFVDAFIEAYSPPAEPFRVVMPGGEVLLFRALQSDLEWSNLQEEARKTARRIKEDRLPVKWAKVASSNSQRNALAYTCFGTMEGWHTGYSISDDGDMVLKGEMLPAWDYTAWLKLTKNAPTVFDAIQSRVDAGQVRGKAVYQQQEIDEEKKD